MGSKLLFGAVAAALCLGFSLPASAQTPQPCTAPASWFPHSQTPEPDSAGFQSTSNCVFHQWSWQSFLWLTQDVNGKPRFEHFTKDGIETTPGVLDPLIGRSGKARTLDLINQAGPDGIMVDLQGHAIYYEIFSDSTFGDFIQKNGLLDPAKLRAFDANTSFPIDSLTLKAAWKVVTPGEDVSSFYTRRARVAVLTEKDGKITVATEMKDGKEVAKTISVPVALVGFHIGGTVNGHPEMIWATFEHVNNAPDLPVAADKMLPNRTVSNKNWTFYKANTPFKDCNVNSAGAGSLKLDEKNQTLSPVTEVCRIVPFGGGETGNIDNIKTLNASVHSQLKDVWNNYFEVGAIWFAAIDGLKPDCTFQPGSLSCGISLTGSTQLSNTTIETFTQSQSAQDNCFACHNTVQVTSPDTTTPSLPGKNVNISHILINNYFGVSELQPQK